jgi:hypothetical protein
MYLYFTYGYFFLYYDDNKLTHSEVFDIIKDPNRYHRVEYTRPHNRDRILITYDGGNLSINAHRYDTPDGYINIDITKSIGTFAAYIYSGRYVIPYQSSYMKKSGKMQYADKNLFTQFLQKKNEANKYSITYERHGFTANNPGDSDFHKLGPEYKYVYDIDPNTAKFTENIYKVCQWITINKFDLRKKFMFIPHITDSVKDEGKSISQHNYYDRVFIVENQKFILSYPQESRGDIIYSLNSYFDSLQNMEKLIGHDDISDILAIEFKKAYGLNQADILKKINARDSAINMTYVIRGKERPTVDKCNEIKQTYINKLKLYGKLQYIPDDDKDRVQCESSLLNESLWGDIGSIDGCKHKYMAYDDTLDGSSFVPYCYDILRSYDNQRIKDKILKMIPEPISNKVRVSRTIDPADPHIVKFKIFDYYMPEWRYHMLNDDFNQAFNSRQMIISDSNLTYFLRQCSKIFRSDPFISKTYNIPGIVHDITWNKVVIACIAQSDLLFPIRIVDAGSIERLSMYRKFEYDADYNYIGAMVTDMNNGKDYTHPTYFISYVYQYRNKLRMTNFRGNVLANGTILEYIRALYLELTVLKYYDKDIGTHIYFYKYVYEDGSGMYDVYVSKYNKIQINKQYTQKYGDIVTYVDKLVPVKLEKEGRQFKFVEIRI